MVITLALPVLDSQNSTGPQITASSLGGDPFDLSDAQPGFLLAWAAVLGCAASAWLLRSLRWWSVVAILVAVVLGGLLLTMLLDPPSILWDGVDDRGRPTGRQAIGEPAAGAVVWAAGIGALLAAGVLGLAGRPVRRNPTP